MADEHDTPAPGPAQDARPAEPAVPPPGQALRDARAAKGLSLDELVIQTKLPRSTLEAMEADDFRTLSEPVYVRGYYRKYVRALGIDEGPILAGYEAHGGGVMRRPEVSLLVPDDPRPASRWPLVFGVLLLGAVLLFGIRWLLGRDAEVPQPPAVSSVDSGVRSAPTTASRPAAAPPTVRPPATRDTPEAATANDAEDEAPDAKVAEPAAPNRRAAAEAASPRPAAQAEARPAQQRPAEPSPPPPAAVGADTLALVFEQDSWVRVEDETGERLLNGLVSAGQRRSLDGVPPYSVFLGYAPGVTVRYQGRDVPVAPHTRGNNTARFVVE